MSGSARNYRSVRDLTEERQPPTKIRKHNAWSDFEENRSELPTREPLHGNRYVQKDGSIKLDRQRSPGFDRWGYENKSQSPSDSWDLSQRRKGMSRGRSRSRSRGRGRGRSRSRSRSRSAGRGKSRSRSRSRGRARDRSRSPFDVHKRVSYGRIDRRSGTEMSSQQCRYFVAGRCNKGSQCKFFHPDNLSSRDGKYLENDLADRRRGRLEYRDVVEFGDNEGLADNPRDYGKDEPLRGSNKETLCCKDFLKGRCQRGASCRYPHHGGSGDDYERGNRNVSADYDLRQQLIRSGKPPCKDFGMGKCHRDDCRYSHDDPAAAENRSDDRRGRNFDEKTRSWNGPTWDDVKGTSDTAKSTGWGEGSVVNPKFHDPMAGENRSDDLRRRNFNEKTKSWNGPTWDDVKDTSDAAKSTGWGDGSVGNTKLNDPMVAEKWGDDRRGRNLDEKTKPWNGPTWDDVKDTSDAAKSAGWGEGSVGNTKFRDPTSGENRSDDRRRRNFDEKTKSWNGPTWDDVKGTSEIAKSTGWGDGSVGNMKIHDPMVAGKQSDDRRGHNLDEKSKSGNGRTWDDVKDTSDAAKSTGWGEASVGNTKFHDPTTGEKRIDDNSGRNFDEKTKSWNGPTWDDVKGASDTAKSGGWGARSVGNSTFHNPMAAEERDPHLENESTTWANPGGKDKADEKDERVSPHRDPQIRPKSSQSQTHEISMHVDEQNLMPEAGGFQIVTTVTPTQVSDNSHNIAITEDFNALNEVKVSGQSNQNGESIGFQPLPTSTVTDLCDQGAHLTSSNGHSIDLNVPLQNMNHENETDILPKESVKPLEILDIGPPRVMPEVCRNVVNPEIGGTIDSKQEQENIHGGSVEGHGKVDESNSSKDEKAMRVFKIVLVEFVKEILKPKWKEGQMSREVHKTIVKKTVDKVTSTIPDDQIPNTQEKIDQYLSFSKGKLAKLVQAYVERFLKT